MSSLDHGSWIKPGTLNEKREQAIKAIIARANGVWDYPELAVCGPMTGDFQQDTLEILACYDLY